MSSSAPQGRLIWLLEDSPVEADLAAQVLREVGEVQLFSDGLRVVESLRSTSRPPDVMVLDWFVPGMTGLEVCEFVRKDFDEVTLPIVMLTGSSAKDDLVRALSTGANDFLVKPFRPAELLARVVRALRIRSLGQQAESARALVQTNLAAAQASGQHKDRSISVLGHDLRNPLSAILGSANLLRSTHDPATVTRIAARIERSVRRMGALVDDILEFARLRPGQDLVLSARPANMEALCREAAEEIRVTYPERSIRVVGAGNLLGSWDQRRVMQALSNLLANAVQHGASDSPIDVRADGSDPRLVSVSVENWGDPIPAAELPTLFEAFRVGGRAGAGIGLGLFVVKEVIKAHGGNVAVASSADGATTFTITVPREISEPRPAPGA